MEITCCHDFVAKFPSHQILLKNSTLNWFDEKKLRGSEFHSAHQVWESTIKRDHTQKIREIDSLVTTLTKTLIWRKNVDFSVKIVIACYTQCGNYGNTLLWKLLRLSRTHFWQKFREINGFTKEITKELIWRNIFLVRPNFSFFHIVGNLLSLFFGKNFVKLMLFKFTK